MPMPDTVNGLPLKPGSWESHEDDLLATFQLKLGNRCGRDPSDSKNNPSKAIDYSRHVVALFTLCCV